VHHNNISFIISRVIYLKVGYIVAANKLSKVEMINDKNAYTIVIKILKKYLNFDLVKKNIHTCYREYCISGNFVWRESSRRFAAVSYR